MSATYVFPLLLAGLWIVNLILFAWVHRPQPTIAEVIRGLESRP